MRISEALGSSIRTKANQETTVDAGKLAASGQRFAPIASSQLAEISRTTIGSEGGSRAIATLNIYRASLRDGARPMHAAKQSTGLSIFLSARNSFERLCSKAREISMFVSLR